MGNRLQVLAAHSRGKSTKYLFLVDPTDRLERCYRGGGGEGADVTGRTPGIELRPATSWLANVLPQLSLQDEVSCIWTEPKDRGPDQVLCGDDLNF